MREKRKEGKVQKETGKSTVYKTSLQTQCLERSHPCDKTAMRSASLVDERHFCFDIFLWRTYRMSIFVPGSIADNIPKSSVPGPHPLRQRLIIFLQICIVIFERNGNTSFLSSGINQEHSHWCRCILTRFKAMRLREEPDPSLKVTTAIDLKECMWTFNIRKACKRALVYMMHADVPKLSLTHINTSLATTISSFGFENL